MPIRVRCIGMYCGMYCGMYWWYVLNTYKYVFNTNRYVFNTFQPVLACIVLVLRTNWIIIHASTDSIHTRIHARIHARIQRKLVGIYCNTCQYIPGCIGMYFLGIWYVSNNHTCQYRPNTCLLFQYVPMLTAPDAITFTNMIPIQSNADQYKPKYRPIQAQIQTNKHRFQ